MSVLICPICGTKKEYNRGLKTYCSKSCANKGTPKFIKNRVNHAEIRKLSKEGVKRSDIAEAVGCNISTVNRVVAKSKK